MIVDGGLIPRQLQGRIQAQTALIRVTRQALIYKAIQLAIDGLTAVTPEQILPDLHHGEPILMLGLRLHFAAQLCSSCVGGELHGRELRCHFLLADAPTALRQGGLGVVIKCLREQLTGNFIVLKLNHGRATYICVVGSMVVSPPEKRQYKYISSNYIYIFMSTADNLDWNLRIGWGVGSLGATTLINGVTFIALFYLTAMLGMSPALAGSLLFAAKLFDILTDPLMGWISDRDSQPRRPPTTLPAAGSLCLWRRLPAAV